MDDNCLKVCTVHRDCDVQTFRENQFQCTVYCATLKKNALNKTLPSRGLGFYYGLTEHGNSKHRLFPSVYARLCFQRQKPKV